MSITKELRESMDPCISDDWLTIEKSVFEIIADRIDAEADRLCDVASEYAYDIGFDDGWQAAMDELDD